MAEHARNLQTKTLPMQSPKSRFNPARYFRNRATFSQIRRSLRGHHLDASRGKYQGAVYSASTSDDGPKVSISKAHADRDNLSRRHVD